MTTHNAAKSSVYYRVKILGEREVDGVALNKFKGVGSIIALSKTDESRVNSRDQPLVMTSFHVAGEDAGILRALTITLVRKGRSSSKEGTVLKIGGRSLSGMGAETKVRTGSGRALGRHGEEGVLI